jgi:hypothetical protein
MRSEPSFVQRVGIALASTSRWWTISDTSWSEAFARSSRRRFARSWLPEVEKKAARLRAKELRDEEEKVRERDRQIAALRRQVTSLSKKLPSPRAQDLGRPCIRRRWLNGSRTAARRMR